MENNNIYNKYIDIDTKYKKEYKTIQWRGREIKVSQYLPIDEKIALIDITIQKAIHNGIIHPAHLKKYYELGLVYMYSDIIFTEEDRADESRVYDKLYASGLLNEVIKNIPAKEIQTCAEILKETKQAIERYQTSSMGIIDNVVRAFSEELPTLLNQLEKLPQDKLTQIFNLFPTKAK